MRMFFFSSPFRVVVAVAILTNIEKKRRSRKKRHQQQLDCRDRVSAIQYKLTHTDISIKLFENCSNN